MGYIGSVVYMDLGVEVSGLDKLGNVFSNMGLLNENKLSLVEHTGIYVGNNRIVELHGSGKIRLVDSNEFLNSSKQRVGKQIYIASNKFGFILSDRIIALRALKKLDERWEYNLLQNNCHEFVAGCITGEFENEYNLFTLLNILISEKLNDNKEFIWRKFNPVKLSYSEERWTDEFFEAFKKFLKISLTEKDIKKVFKVSGLSDVLKGADKNRKEFLKDYSEIVKLHLKTLK